MNATELGAVLDAHGLWLAAQGGKRANLTRANLTRANLARAYLAGAYLAGANLTGANLAGAYLARANLTGANLARADLTRANLAGADLAGANLTGANLARADLAGADLAGANLAGANLAGANLTGADLAGAKGIRWAVIGPVGQGRRLLTAYDNGSTPEPQITGGCFHGSFAEFRAVIAKEAPWEWGDGTPEDRVRWRRECSDAADLLELAVHS